MRTNDELTRVLRFAMEASAWRLGRASTHQRFRGPEKARMLRTAVIAIIFMAIWPIASLHASASSYATVAAIDLIAHAVVARDTFACHSPWQVIEGRECHGLPAGTEVNIVGGDDFFACVVWPGTQRCMWVARDALRRP